MTGEQRLGALGMVLVAIVLISGMIMLFINQQTGRDVQKDCIKSGYTISKDDNGYKVCRME